MLQNRRKLVVLLVLMGFAFVFNAQIVAANATDLLISEYIEGSSLNKAIEIYNGTGSPVDLAAGGYQLDLYFNGSSSAQTSLSLAGILADGDVYVIADDGADPAILAQADLTPSNSFFNGDDAIALSKNGTLVDVIGQIGFDPPSGEWGTGDNSTQNNTIRRNSDVCQGDANGADPFDTAAEWSGFEINTFDGLGAHTANCDGPPPPPNVFINEIRVNISGSEFDFFEIQGAAGTDLTGLTYVALSGEFSPGQVDFAISLDGQTIPGDGLFWADGAGNASADFATSFNFFSSPQTHLIVSGFTGSAGDDYDADNDGVLDTTPWDTVVDSVSMIDGDTTADVNYSGVVIGPDGNFLPAGIFRCDDAPAGLFDTANLLSFFNMNDDTPGTSNVPSCPSPVVEAKIHEVQGSGATVALDGQEVSVEAIVVGDFQAGDQLRGFFIQEEDGDTDADTTTSEGIFVFCGGCATDVAVGDLVQVTGLAEDFFDMSQLDVPGSAFGNVSVVSSGNTLPSASVISFPASGSTVDTATFENVEGMLITSSNELFVSEYFQLGRYGQLVLTANARPHQFTDVSEPDVAGYAAFLDNLAKTRIILDDDNNIQNAPIASSPDSAYYWPRPGLSTSNFVRGGDSISGLSGVMHWSFAGSSGTNAWRIRPVDEAFSYNFVSNNSRQAAPDPVGGNYKVASFNVLNYFTTLDERGAHSIAELDRQREKISAAICAIDADVVGLIEIENNGATAISDLLNGTNGINAQCGTYAFVDTGVIGSDEIAVAFIYKTATTTTLGNFSILDSSVDLRFNDDKNRPALAQTFKQTPNGGVLTVVVNHLKSKGSACDDVGDPNLNDGAANCNLTRANAAAAMVDWLATDPTGSADGDFLIIGDLNAYRNEDPIDNIELGADDTAATADDYVDLLDANLGAGAYSFVFDGQLGYLDYALANQILNEQVTGVTAWHINADEINIFDYNDDVQDPGEPSFLRESGALPVYEANAFRASDHDPIIVGFDLDNDLDNDGVIDDFDLCSDTALPEDTPPDAKKNRFYVNGEGEFVDGEGNLAGISIHDTFGCSGIQIINAMGLGNGHIQQGITRGALLDWIALNS